MDVISGFNTYPYLIYENKIIKYFVIQPTFSEINKREKSFGQLVINLQYNKRQ